MQEINEQKGHKKVTMTKKQGHQGKNDTMIDYNQCDE